MERRDWTLDRNRGLAHPPIGVGHLDDSKRDDNRKCNHHEQPPEVPFGSVEVFSGNAGCEFTRAGVRLRNQ